MSSCAMIEEIFYFKSKQWKLSNKDLGYKEKIQKLWDYKFQGNSV